MFYNASNVPWATICMSKYCTKCRKYGSAFYSRWFKSIRTAVFYTKNLVLCPCWSVFRIKHGKFVFFGKNTVFPYFSMGLSIKYVRPKTAIFEPPYPCTPKYAFGGTPSPTPGACVLYGWTLCKQHGFPCLIIDTDEHVQYTEFLCKKYGSPYIQLTLSISNSRGTRNFVRDRESSS